MAAQPHEPDPATSWRNAPSSLSVTKNDVHVWRVDLDEHTSRWHRFKDDLSVDEQQRADRFKFEEHRGRFVVGRAALRSILARYVGSAPTELRFVYGDHGKPDLAGQSGPDALRFNLAHSAGLAVAALARGRAVGIDLERIAARGSLMRIAERFFTWREDLAIKALPEAQRTRAFFTCWTRKEAYIKALGDGLAIALNRFEVPVLPDQAPFVRTLIELSPPAIRCSMIDLSVAPDYTAALAVEGSGWAASCWRFAISK